MQHTGKLSPNASLKARSKGNINYKVSKKYCANREYDY